MPCLAGWAEGVCDRLLDEDLGRDPGGLGGSPRRLDEAVELVEVQDDHVLDDASSRSSGVVRHAEPIRLDLELIGRVSELLVETVDDKPPKRPHTRVVQRLDDDFRTNTGRITHGDADRRSGLVVTDPGH